MDRILHRARTLKGLLKLKPFDVSTQEGRSLERYRRAALTTLTSVMARCVAVVTGLITVRLTVRYLGTERYGLWMTITSVVSMMAFADLGIGNGLLNSVSEAHGRDDRESVRKYVTSAFFVLLGIATALLASFAIAYPLVPWPRVFNVSSAQAVREAGPAVVVFLVCFALNMPLDVVQRVQTGYQEGFETSLWQVAGAVTGFAFLLLAMHFKAGLPWLILSLSGGPLLGILANWSHEFVWVRPWLLPDWTCWDAAAARKILGTGVMFVVIQACGIFTVSVDNIVITQVLGPAAVTQYAVPMRMFILVRSAAAMFVMPLWPAYGEALSRGDVHWARKTLARSIGFTVLAFGPLALGLALFGKPIVHVWVGPQIQPPNLLLWGAAVWVIVDLCGNAVGIFLFGANLLKLQAVLYAVTAMVNLPVKVLAAKSFGLSGVIWATALIAPLGAGASAVYAYRFLKKIKNSSRPRMEAEFQTVKP
jgi:O-antigen/teichoic acid export membrane protein